MNREGFPMNLAPDLVRDFVEAHQRYTESPDEFIATSALYAGSIVAGRWVEFNNQFLNNYYLIVGPTGTAKKTTGQKLSMKLLTDVKLLNPFLQFRPIEIKDNEEQPVGPDSAYPLVTHFSIEGLQSHAVGDGTSTAIQMGEYGSLFQVGKRQSQQNTISELTNIALCQDRCRFNNVKSIRAKGHQKWFIKRFQKSLRSQRFRRFSCEVQNQLS